MGSRSGASAPSTTRQEGYGNDLVDGGEETSRLKTSATSRLRMEAIKKLITILYDLIVIGKSVSIDLQLKRDVRMAKRIREAAEEFDEEKLRKVMMRGHVFLGEEDIVGLAVTPINKTRALVSIDFLIMYKQMYLDLRRCKRSRGRK